MATHPNHHAAPAADHANTSAFDLDRRSLRLAHLVAEGAVQLLECHKVVTGRSFVDGSYEQAYRRVMQS